MLLWFLTLVLTYIPQSHVVPVKVDCADQGWVVTCDAHRDNP